MAEAIERLPFPHGYTRIRGGEIEGPTKKALAHLHLTGPADDGIVRPETVAEFAAVNGYDLLPTPHNNLWGSEAVFNEVEKQRYGITVEPGFEYAALPEEGEQGKARHIIVFGVDTLPQPGLTEVQLNRWVHHNYRDGLTIAAHPGLTVISTSTERIEALNGNHDDPEAGYDGVEDYNPAVDITFRKAREYDSNPVGGCLVDFLKLPRRDLNAATQAFMAEKAQWLGLVSFAGSDGHSLRTAEDVVWVYPAQFSPLEALRKGETSVYIREVPTEVTPGEFGLMKASDALGRAWHFVGDRWGDGIMTAYGGK